MSISNLNCYYKDYKRYLRKRKKVIETNDYYKYLVKGLLKRASGRNNNGFITAYNRGGGVKSLFRKLCFNYIKLYRWKYKKWLVLSIEYDSNRTSNIALLQHRMTYDRWKEEKERWYWGYFFNKYYIYRLANEGLKKGDVIEFYKEGQEYDPRVNQFAMLKDIGTGTYLCNIEFLPFTKGKLIRSAGSKAKILRKYEKYALLSLPSGEKKLLLISCFATVGRPSNIEYLFQRNFKAGNSRLKGRRPKVRGVAKNPVDHPHGGGEGKSSGGRHSVSRWGKLTKGYVTKRKKIKKRKKYE